MGPVGKKRLIVKIFGACRTFPDAALTFDADAGTLGRLLPRDGAHGADRRTKPAAGALLGVGFGFGLQKACRLAIEPHRGIVRPDGLPAGHRDGQRVFPLPQRQRRFAGKFRRSRTVLPVRPAMRQHRGKGVLRRYGRPRRSKEPIPGQNLAQLLQGVIIAAVAVQHHRHRCRPAPGKIPPEKGQQHIGQPSRIGRAPPKDQIRFGKAVAFFARLRPGIIQLPHRQHQRLSGGLGHPAQQPPGAAAAAVIHCPNRLKLHGSPHSAKNAASISRRSGAIIGSNSIRSRISRFSSAPGAISMSKRPSGVRRNTARSVI